MSSPSVHSTEVGARKPVKHRGKLPLIIDAVFLKNLEAQMSPEQRAYWVPKVERFEIFGCYAQTEVGHGSNVKGIETTATFDEEADEFVLNSPSVSSTKFWIGSLGVWATHAIVVARLLVKGTDYGNHLFLTQVRNLDTQELEPDVVIHDQGEKAMGTYAGMDNGAMRLHRKRIPRSQMLAGYASVDRDGTYYAADNSKHSYTSMVIIRGLMAQEIGQDVAKAIVIAIRYAEFRRQFNGKDGEEMKVIEYASVKKRLYPALCRAVVMMLNGHEIKTRVEDVRNANLEDLHYQTVGAKVYSSERGVRDVEVARLACGGHGMIASAGLGALYALLSPSRTYEGETYVLSLQIGKAIVKHWNNNSENTISALSYLQRLRKPNAFSNQLRISHVNDWLDTKTQQEVLEHRAAILAWRHLQDTHHGKDTSYDTFALTMAHADFTFWKGLQAQLPRVPRDGASALQALAHVFSLNTIIEGLSAFAGHGFLSAESIQHLRDCYDTAVDDFVPHTAEIIDALSFTDFETDSVLCRGDRDPYESIDDQSRRSALNDSHAIRPLIIGARSIWKGYEGAKL